MLRPQLVSSAAWATRLTGLTPSCRAACCASGHSDWANCSCCAVLGQELAVERVAAAEAAVLLVPAAAELPGVPLAPLDEPAEPAEPEAVELP
jgi:hypothetical protein